MTTLTSAPLLRTPTELLVAAVGLVLRVLASAPGLRASATRSLPALPVPSRPVVRLVAAGPAAVHRRLPPVPGDSASPRTPRRLRARDLVLPALLLAEFVAGVLVGVLT